MRRRERTGMHVKAFVSSRAVLVTAICSHSKRRDLWQVNFWRQTKCGEKYGKIPARHVDFSEDVTRELRPLGDGCSLPRTVVATGVKADCRNGSDASRLPVDRVPSCDGSEGVDSIGQGRGPRGDHPVDSIDGVVACCRGIPREDDHLKRARQRDIRSCSRGHKTQDEQLGTEREEKEGRSNLTHAPYFTPYSFEPQGLEPRLTRPLVTAFRR